MPRATSTIYHALFAITLLTASLAAAPARGQETDEETTEKPEVIEAEIVVTSTMLELATEQDLPGDQLRSEGKADVGESLRDVAGLAASRRGAINLDPSIRGLQETQVGMFVDGTRTFAAGPARMDSDLSHVDTHMVQNVRVVKGPYALAWGAGTLSAIELETHRPPFSRGGTELGAALRLGYASNAERRDAHGAFWAAGEKLRFRLDLARREGDDYEDGDGVSVPADYESSNVRWRLGYRPSEGSLLEWSGGYQEQFDLDYPGRLLDATYFYTRSQALEWSRTDLGGLTELFAQVYANRKDHRMNNDEKPTAQPAPNRIPPFGLRVDLPAESNTFGGKVRTGFTRGDIDWSFGSDFYRLEQTATRSIFRRDLGVKIFEDIVWPDARLDDLGGWGQLVQSGDRYRLGATVRVDTVDTSIGELSPFFVANTAADPDSGETSFSAAVSAAIELGERWSLQLGAGRSVRTATILERYSDRFPSTKFQIAAEFMGNPQLDPETSLQLDAGIRGRFGNLLVQVDTYYRTIDDYITVVADPTLPRRLPLSPPVVYRYVNGTEATFWGGELLLDHRVTPWFSWRGSLAYVRGEDKAFEEPVLGLQPLTARLALRFRAIEQRLWVELGAKLVDRQDRVATRRFERPTPGYTVLNLAAGYRIDERWSVTGGVENLGDRAYADHLNSPNPFNGQRIAEIGRTFRLGLEVDF